MLTSYYYSGINKRLKVMRGGIQKKVAKYREQKSKQAKLQSFISEKRKNIERLMQQQPPIERQQELNLQKFASDIDLKHRKYLQDIAALEEVKLNIIEARGAMDGLALEVKMQEDTLATLRKTCGKEVGSQEEMVDQLRGRLQGERTQRARMEQERCQRHLQHVQKLTNQKEELISRIEEMLNRRKNFEGNLKKMKDSFQQDCAKVKKQCEEEEEKRKALWQAKKLEEITQNTLKGLEPEINRIVGSSRREIAKIQEKYESLKNDYKREMNQQFQANLRQIRREITDRTDQEKTFLIQRANQQHRKQMEKLLASFQTEKTQIKVAKEAEMKDLQGKRKRQSEEFMLRNKDYLLSHMNQVKQLKSSYEKQIRDLDGSLDKQLWREQAAIQQKYKRKMEAHREEKRKELQAKVKAFHVRQKQESETQYQDIVQKVAVQNQTIQSGLRKQTDAKVKEFKENYERQLKTIRKTIQALMGKEKQEMEALQSVKEVKKNIQQEHDELLSKYEFLKKKEIEYQTEVVRLKSKESQFIQSQDKDLKRIQQQWKEQIDLLQQKIVRVQAEMQTQEKIMQEKQDEERSRIAGVMNKLEKESLQFMRKVNEDIERTRKEKAMKVALNGKLLEMKKKLKDMEAKRRQ